VLRAWGWEKGEGQGAGEAEVGLIKLQLRVEIGEGKAAAEQRLGGLEAKFMEVQSCLLTILEHILTRSFQSLQFLASQCPNRALLHSHNTSQHASSSEELLQTGLTATPTATANLGGGRGYMGQLADVKPRSHRPHLRRSRGR
jgi:hypothetical protein